MSDRKVDSAALRADDQSALCACGPASRPHSPTESVETVRPLSGHPKEGDGVDSIPAEGPFRPTGLPQHAHHQLSSHDTCRLLVESDYVRVKPVGEGSGEKREE